MKKQPFYVDLHLHSHYSRATGKLSTPEGLSRFAQLKGVDVLGTGDCTHPLWFSELSGKLVPEGNGLYHLREPDCTDVPPACRRPVRFMVTGEISSIYRRDGVCHKVHNVVIFPSLEAAARLNARLEKIGNIHSDGRPILGLDPRDLMEMTLEADPEAVFIPAHIWTPWFSMLGAKSGFDSLEACFGPLSGEIFAVETGLSSDVPMNRRIRFLDRLTLVSNSDAHSPGNLGRNATCFWGEPDYSRIMRGLRNRDPEICGGTVDLFPEEGKYHLDGHRACKVCLEPEESMALGNRCPVCGKPLTIGVLHRVVELERMQGDELRQAPPIHDLPYRYIIPLPELIANRLGVASTTSKKVQKRYAELLASRGPELPLLLDQGGLEELGEIGEAISAVRQGRVVRQGGYDGVYGRCEPVLS